MTRIQGRFNDARAAGRGALIPYLTLGYPSMDTSVATACAIADAAADIVELGVPFSDPVADGPVIQRASEAALKAGATLERCLAAAAEIRRKTEAGLVLFSYFNPLLQYGLDRVAGRLSDAGVDGVLVTDVVPEEGEDFRTSMQRSGIDTVFLAAPTSTRERLGRICAASSGFVYAVARTGVTGERSELTSSARELVERLRGCTELPIAVGFGISSAAQVREVWRYADGAVVGSRIVAEIERSVDAPDLPSRIAALVSDLVNA